MDINNFNLQKELENSYKVEKNLRDKLKNEIDAEEEVRQSAEAIANSLLSIPKVKAEIDGRPFLITMKIQPLLVKKIHVTNKDIIEVTEDHIILVIADINKYNLTGGKYLPFTAKGKVDKNYSLKDNIKTVVEGFIRHVTGLIKPEILE